jgi:hypothetical protein
MKVNKEDYIALKDVPGFKLADLSKTDPNNPYANDPYFVKKNEEAQRRLAQSYWPKEILECKK